jgi:hypothetical protein
VASYKARTAGNWDSSAGGSAPAESE